jgi:Tol biopolymer transport system component
MAKREILLAAAGILIGLVALLFWLSPRVIGTNISESGQSSWQPIQIRLSQPVDPKSVADRFVISPHIEGELAVGDRELIYTPAEAFDYGQEYRISLQSGISGQNSLPLWRSSDWTFTVAEPQLVYMRQDGEVANLWQDDLQGREIQLTDETLGIWDYQIVPQGKGILYSALAPDGTMDLVHWQSEEASEMILDCTDSLCRAAVWQPGGKLVAYERVYLDEATRPGEVWLLDTVTGRQQPAHVPEILREIEVTSLSSYSPQWSADGRFLSYYHAEGRLIVVRDFLTGENSLIPSNLELMGEWSPVDYLLAYTELTFGKEIPDEHDDDEHQEQVEGSNPSLFNHLIVADVINETVSDLSERQETNDGLPAWHPDGSTLALGRSAIGSGKQLWLSPLGDKEAIRITDELLFNHSAPSWSPDGRRLAYMRFAIANSAGSPGIWIYDMVTDQHQLVVEDAFLPGWLE